MTTPTTTTTLTVRSWQISEYLRGGADNFLRSSEELVKAGYDSDHPLVKMFYQQYTDARAIADAISTSVRIDVENLEYESVFTITSDITNQ